ncbi:MAG: NADP-dependent phosphogluconate dehydrogenase [Candidatus Margulisiibacteriota bacterium]|jgi:6-phosphogluconate dehydrogenase
MDKKNIGFIGLGKMGLPIAARLAEQGIPLTIFDTNPEAGLKIQRSGLTVSSSLVELVQQLPQPRVIFLCVTAGKVIDDIITQLILQMQEGDTLIDLGNSFYQDTMRRSELLSEKGINFIDVGMSGGLAGAENGACLMIGGNEEKVKDLDYLFKIIAAPDAYRYFGASGAGHLVKGFHNLIEYGYLQSLAEGLASLAKIFQEQGRAFDFAKVCDIWSRGSIIESKIVLDAKEAFQKYGDLEVIAGAVSGQTIDEMKNLVKVAENSGTEIYACKAAIMARIDSQKNPNFTGKIINAIRNVFGGHKEWQK